MQVILTFIQVHLHNRGLRPGRPPSDSLPGRPCPWTRPCPWMAHCPSKALYSVRFGVPGTDGLVVDIEGHCRSRSITGHQRYIRQKQEQPTTIETNHCQQRPPAPATDQWPLGFAASCSSCYPALRHCRGPAGHGCGCHDWGHVPGKAGLSAARLSYNTTGMYFCSLCYKC